MWSPFRPSSMRATRYFLFEISSGGRARRLIRHETEELSLPSPPPSYFILSLYLSFFLSFYLFIYLFICSFSTPSLVLFVAQPCANGRKEATQLRRRAQRKKDQAELTYICVRYNTGYLSTNTAFYPLSAYAPIGG